MYGCTPTDRVTPSGSAEGEGEGAQPRRPLGAQVAEAERPAAYHGVDVGGAADLIGAGLVPDGHGGRAGTARIEVGVVSGVVQGDDRGRAERHSQPRGRRTSRR